MQRRDFLRSLAGAAVAGPLAARALHAMPPLAWSPARRLTRVGVQLYTLRDDARKDLEATLAALRAAGYDDIELLGSMNNFGRAPKALRATLDRVGLKAPSTHVAFSAVDPSAGSGQALERTLDDALTLGHEYVIVASLPEARTTTLDGWRTLADRMNEAGAVARKRGVWIGFHNHAGDFKKVEGQVPYDIFIERTDKSVTRHQLDTGNIAQAGIDPLVYMRKYGDRYWQFHIKDVPSLGAASDTELGKGVIDLKQLVAMIDHVDEKHLFVEQETYPGAPIDSARRDQQWLRKMEF